MCCAKSKQWIQRPTKKVSQMWKPATYGVAPDSSWSQHGSWNPAVIQVNTEWQKQTRTFSRQLWVRTCRRVGASLLIWISSQISGVASLQQPECCIVYCTHDICRAVLQTLEAIAEYGMPCQMTDRGNHGEFTRFFAVCIKNVIRHNAMRRPLYQQQQAQRTKKRIWLGHGTSLHIPMSEVVPVKLS